jgi:hypothetical protein
MTLLAILNTSEFMPHFWGRIILLAEQLLSPEEREQLHAMIFEVEKMVLETEIVPVEEEGGIKWVERTKGQASFYDIEMAMESQSDFYCYFEKEDGTHVTRFDVERRLDSIRKWLFDRVRERSMGRRFMRPR